MLLAYRQLSMKLLSTQDASILLQSRHKSSATQISRPHAWVTAVSLTMRHWSAWNLDTLAEDDHGRPLTSVHTISRKFDTAGFPGIRIPNRLIHGPSCESVHQRSAPETLPDVSRDMHESMLDEDFFFEVKHLLGLTPNHNDAHLHTLGY